MRFNSDSQRRAVFANMMNVGVSSFNTVKFSKKKDKVKEDEFDDMGEDYIKWHIKKYGEEPDFARKPSSKMIRELAEGLDEPITDFEQVVPNSGARQVDVITRDVSGLGSVRERRRDVVSEVKSFPEHGYRFFTPETSGSLEEAEEQAGSVAEAISGGNAIGWSVPIWVDGKRVGYTVRLKNIDTGEDLLETDSSVYEEMN